MLIAEDLLLLLTDDRTGRLLAASTQVDVALGGALLIELALAERVELAAGRLVVRDGSPTSDPLLDEALAEVAAKEGKKPKDVVRGLGKGLRDRLYDRLVGLGILHAERGAILGVLPVHRWPATDARHETDVRELLARALRTGAADDERTGALVALLHALGAVAKVIDPAAARLSGKELKASAERIAEGDWGARAVRQAIDALLAATIAATTSASVVPSGGS